MSREMDALIALKTYLPAMMDTTPYAALTQEQVVIKYPDVDNMPFPTMLYIVPDIENREWVSMNTLGITLNIKIYLIVKQMKMETLINASFEYFAALDNAINHDPTLGGSIAEAFISGTDFYPAIESLTTAAGMEISATLKFERNVLAPGEYPPAPDLVPLGE